MKFHLKYICASFLILMSGMMSAQNAECLTLTVSYSMDLDGSSEISGSAVVTFQDKAFTAVGDGIEVYCDGVSVWTVDSAAKEVYIETLSVDNDDYMTAAAPKLMNMDAGAEADFDAPEGTTVHVKVLAKKKSDRKDVSSFRPTQKFDSSWVVTDLR